MHRHNHANVLIREDKLVFAEDIMMEHEKSNIPRLRLGRRFTVHFAQCDHSIYCNGPKLAPHSVAHQNTCRTQVN